MHMGTSLDSRDHRHSYVGYVFQNLNAFVVNLTPDAGIGDIAERGPIDISNELPACARQDYDLVRPILRNPVEGIDKFCVRLRGHDERSAAGSAGHRRINWARIEWTGTRRTERRARTRWFKTQRT